MALAFIAQSVGSALIGNLVDTCSSYIMACPAASGMQDELDRLHYDLPQVEAVLTAVEEGAPAMMQNEGLRMWLWQLRDAVENAEDVLDELKYYELEKIIRDRDDKVRGNILSECKIKIDSFIKGIFPDDTLERLKEAVKVLNKVIYRMGPFLQLAIGFYGPSVKRQKLEEVKNARETSSLLIESEVFGRDKERDTIVEWLIKPVDGESEGITFNVSAYTIVGMGGFGKTTLAQLIYHDERVREYFDPIMWVCVSQDFDAAAIIRKMLKVENSGKSLDALHEDLKQKLTSNRFLLILDDVWNDDINYMTEWEKLLAPLKFGQRGSKILLTTRMGSVADMAAKVMKCKLESLILNELEESDCMSLFNTHASLDVNSNDYKNLQPIGEQIVQKLGGCPLAIKVMGGLLNSYKDYGYWNRILKEDTMELQQGKEGIMTVLRLSYDHLPINLQVCFRYCSIFPQDYEFNRKELVHMWMGSCLIPQSICERQRSRPEDIGRKYFDLLARKSFFTRKMEDRRDKIYKRYVMHDLLHDLARSVSLGECIRIGGDVAGNIIPKMVRHLSFENINLLSIREIPNLKNLRTLVISFREKHEVNADLLLVFNEVIKGFKNLRLLSLDMNFKFNKSLDALDSLIHLRYLSMWSILTPDEDFLLQPLYRLYHLVVLKFCSNLSRLHANIEYDRLTNLVNLRSLDVHRFVIEKIPYVSKLPCIRKLEDFIVREKSGHKISELKNLRDLHHLCIRGLENVRSSEEAMDAKLNEKEYLKSLTLGWSDDSSNSVETDEQLLDNLRPHVNLKRLCIEGYQGVNSPRWMLDLSLINNLRSIKLMNCEGWEHLPPLGQLPFLNHLELSGLDAVKKIDSSFFGSGGCAFPSLNDLSFKYLSNLEELIGIDDGCMFPKLQTVEIDFCPKLREFFYVGLTALSVINQGCGNNNQEHFKALERVDISDCEELEYVSPELFRESNPLIDLRIIECPKLKTWGISNIQVPSTLNRLTIGSCGDLEMPLLWSENLSSLTSLDLGGCASITSLPPAQVCARWAMLSHLRIENCKELSSLGGIQALVSLRDLGIAACDKLNEVALLQPPFPNDVGQENAVDCSLKLDRLSIDHHALLLMEPLRSLSSISSFTLSRALRFTSLPEEWLLQNQSALTSLPEEWLLQNHSALKYLSISDAGSLQSLPQTMAQLCSLESLDVSNAKLIQSLPDLPTSLHTLRIFGCHPELKERCRENIGLDWPKIANIPQVTIIASDEDSSD